MKKYFTLLLCGFLFLGMSCIPAYADVTTGTWTLDTGLSNGYWAEIFETLGEPGAGGNTLTANDGTQWSLEGKSQPASLTSESETDYTYETAYTGTFDLETDNSKWGDGFTDLSFNGTNYNNGGAWGSDLDFKFTLVGINNNYRYHIVAIFNSTTENIIYTQLGTNASNYFGHAGGPFDSMTLNVSMVPIPGAVLLFGSCLIGIVGIRRRLK